MLSNPLATTHQVPAAVQPASQPPTPTPTQHTRTHPVGTVCLPGPQDMDGAKPNPKEVTPKRSAPDTTTNVVGKTARSKRASSDENSPPPVNETDDNYKDLSLDALEVGTNTHSSRRR